MKFNNFKDSFTIMKFQDIGSQAIFKSVTALITYKTL